MKTNRILSIILIIVMIMSLMTGCGKKVDPVEDAKTIISEMTQVKNGESNIEATINIPKETVDKLEMDTESLSEYGLDELKENVIDKNGNLKLGINANLKYNENKQMDLSLGIFDKSINVIIDDKDVYLEIDSLFDTLSDLLGDSISFIKAFIGDEYKYIKTTSEENEDSSNMLEIKNNIPDINEYITAENIKKDENGGYIITLGKDFIEKCIKEEDREDLFDELEITNLDNSSAILNIVKEKDTNKYILNMTISIENKITFNVYADVIAKDVTIEIPPEDVVYNPEDNSLDNDLSFDNDNNSNIFSGEDEYWEDTYSDDIYLDDDFSDWDIGESKELPHKIETTDDYLLKFIFDNPEMEAEEVDEKIQEILSTSLDVDGNKMDYTIETKYLPEYARYYGDFGQYIEDIQIYHSDDWVSVESTYALEPDDFANVDNLVKRIETFNGVKISAKALQDALYEVSEDDIYSVYKVYDDIEFEVYYFDGYFVRVERSIFDFS